ncbi:OsmC family protein [Mucilaginibacter pedocola]|uniref:Osmotically inducible protein OsmC n=1 Tax=Mucilaginibacter pedocola TaxID=1792845 RepID=A0A1S9PBP4_9SPHI|nr:OsmC family protein [Mucilaginibacter pedocola]OOQ58402.1 hypothetical protein BC343_06875 [Mucilaginibacter pedocola]
MKYLLESPVAGTIGLEKYKTEIRWRNGILITDEPEKIGGRDIGPDPYTLLLASLVSCTLATLKMYTDHKGLLLPELVVEANMIHKLDQNGAAMHIYRRIVIPGIEDPALLERLLRVAENCPISKILKGTINIVTEFDPSIGLS